MKKAILILLMFLAFGQMTNATGWVQVASIPSVARSLGVAFSIGAYGYVGTGLDTSAYQGYHCLNDFWQYDTTANAWTQMADFAGSARYSAVGFSIGNKGYIGTGYDLGSFNNDLWEYDPIANSWTQKDTMPVGGRYEAVGFSIGTKGYIGTGGNDTASLTDFWEYDQASDTWTQKADFGGGARNLAVGISINGMGYIGLGDGDDFWQWNLATNIWTQKASFTGGGLASGIGITIGGYGYVGIGNSSSGYDVDTFYRYDPTSDTWLIQPDFIGTTRDGAVGFSIGQNGYVGTGAPSFNQEFGYSDMYKFTPSCTNPVITGASASVTTICSNGSTDLTATGSLNSALNWYWYTEGCGQTFVNAGTTITVNPTITTTYYVQGQGGCATPSLCDSVQILVHQAPSPVINPNASTTFCQGDSVTLNTGTYNSYNWSNAATVQAITVHSTGSYTVTVTDGIGCTGIATQGVTANNNPAPTITGGSILCFGGSLTLDAGSTYNYLWSNGATAETIDITSANTYSVTVTDSNGCSGTASQIVTLNPQISPVITGGNSFCSGDSLTLSTGTYSQYHWSNGATIDSITVYNGNLYMVTVTDINGCTGTTSHSVVENATPSVSLFTIGNTTFCQGDSVTIETGSPYSQYLWNTNATTQAITATTAANYTVTVTALNGCTGTALQAVVVNPSPAPTITPNGNTSFCIGGTVTLIASASSQYSWSNSTTAQSVVVNTSGTYIVTVTNSFNCTGTASQVVTVNPDPTVVITGGSSICSGNNLILNAGNYSLYHWNNNASTQTITVITTGNYSVTVTDSNGCKGNGSQIVNVGTSPTPVITGGSIICAGGSIVINAGTFTGYLWNTGTTTAAITVTTANNYTVTVTDGSGCTGTAMDSVYISSNPAPVITGGTSFCSGGFLNLSVVFFTLYHWSTGAVTESININTPGTYSITVTNINGCTGIASTTITDFQSPAPVITTNGPTIFCNGGSVILKTGNYALYHWSNNAAVDSVIATTAANYTVTVTDINGCTATASQAVTVIANPVPVITPSGTIKLCAGETETLLASNGLAYEWNNGATNQNTTIAQSGTYTVIVYYGVNCSATSNPVTINLFPLPVATISINTLSPVLCSADSIMLTTNSTEPLTYLWNGGVTTQSIWADTAGSFVVEVTDTNNCHSTSSITITAYGNPSAAFTFSNFVTTTTFTNTSANGNDYYWYFGDGTVSNQSNPVHIYSQTGTYTVKLIVTNPCGSDTITHIIDVTGINQIANLVAAFSIYPNPAEDQVTIVFSSAKEAIYTILLMDVTGRIIQSENYTAVIGDNQYELNLSSLAKGVYMVVLQHDHETLQKKIVVQ